MTGKTEDVLIKVLAQDIQSIIEQLPGEDRDDNEAD
jgi:hypothetical protein